MGDYAGFNKELKAVQEERNNSANLFWVYRDKYETGTLSVKVVGMNEEEVKRLSPFADKTRKAKKMRWGQTYNATRFHFLNHKSKKEILIEEVKQQMSTYGVQVDAEKIVTSHVADKGLDFESAGYAVRALIKILGKPSFNYTSIQNYGKLRNRSVAFNCPKEKRKQSVIALLSVGVTQFGLTENRIIVYIPLEVKASVYYKSDDPEDWKQRHQRHLEIAKLHQVEHRLDRG